MITLKKLPFTDGIDSVATLFGYDTKANLQKQSELVGIWIPVSGKIMNSLSEFIPTDKG